MRPDHYKIDSSQGAWSQEDRAERLVLAADGPEGATIELIRMPAGGRVGTFEGETVEILVLDGKWTAPGGELAVGGFMRSDGLARDANRSAEGCALLVRRLSARTTDTIHAPNVAEAWVPGHGNLEVRPLFSDGAVSSALVRWPAGERFVPHRHFGGEEIFVLSGVFQDEHGQYPTGTWLLSPHLSEHHPFVREETLIFVRTGHVPPHPEGIRS